MNRLGLQLKYRVLRLYARMVRERKSPEFVAAGWALGMFIGCAVPFGLQLAVSVPLAFLLKISKVGAVFGTLITNPLTIFIIYPFQTWYADVLFLGGNLSYAHLSGIEWTFDSLRTLGAEVFAAFLLGGIVNALVLAPPTYFGVRTLVRRFRARQDARRKGEKAA